MEYIRRRGWALSLVVVERCLGLTLRRNFLYLERTRHGCGTRLLDTPQHPNFASSNKIAHARWMKANYFTHHEARRVI